ncbi:MAG: hypothetical protein CL435_04170 [Acidimicrobiaceae bacterium]|nr:hypothetical protein [Acidimicrobiaceae bacterium]
MPMREDCKHFESRSYPNGDTVRKCDHDLAPEAPWRCPEECGSFQKRRIDVDWSQGSLVTPATPDEPAGLGDDGSIAALLDAAEDIVNEAAPGVLADFESERGGTGKLRRLLGRVKKERRGKGGGGGSG